MILVNKFHRSISHSEIVYMPSNRNSPRSLSTSIVAVASGKGGVGKTFLSITLASAFSQARQRTLLVDGDIGLANVDVQLGIIPSSDLMAVNKGWIELSDAVVSIDGGASNSGFDVIPGRSGSGAMADLPAHEVKKLTKDLSVLALEYDQMIIDLGAGIEQNSLQIAKAADKALIVITDEPTSMTDAYAYIKVLRSFADDIEPVICINQADTRETGYKTYQAIARACETFLNFSPTLAGVVMYDTKVREAIRKQKTLVTLEPNAQPVRDIVAIAQTLLGNSEEKKRPRKR